MSWVAGIHLYLHFATVVEAGIAKSELENFIYQEKHLERFLQVKFQGGNTVTIQEVDNEIFDMESIATEIQNFCKQKFLQNLQGSWQEENRDGNHYVNEMIDGNVESENGDWLLDYSIPVIRQLRAIAQIITKKT